MRRQRRHQFIDAANQRHVDPATAKDRLAERDAREAADTRNEIQRWLNDPPPDRSALHQVSNFNDLARPPAPLRYAGMRVDLWKR
jgi:hypothetical protein